jgi:galactose mutarotase-like enzyme
MFGGTGICYLAKSTFFGALVGRYASRIAKGRDLYQSLKSAVKPPDSDLDGLA